VITEQRSIGRGLGYEASGFVTKVGQKVTSHRVGDRVIASSSGSFTTRQVISEKLCAKMPDTMSFTEGATMSAVYCTAIYCLLDAGKLKKGQVSSERWLVQIFLILSTQSVLIHSAAGGVGTAAIQIAKMVGAEVC
jgi:NADPH:quinone reductase-like Zn-dependent oxidoreductase